MNKSIFITLDADWANPRIFDSAVQLLESHDVKATIFYTDNLDPVPDHGIAVHPQVSSLLDFETTLRNLLDRFKPARIKICRNHSLVHSSRFLPVYQKLGVKLTSNVLMHGYEGHIGPFAYCNGVIEAPIRFMDDAAMLAPDGLAKLESLLSTKGLKIFSFHPVHLFLNTTSLEHYENAKSSLDDPQKIIPFVNTVEFGVRDAFIKMVKTAKLQGLCCRSLEELIDDTNY